jgi:CBS domain containing-hemolysin-like protein
MPRSTTCGTVREQEYSRLPVYTDNLDNIVGLLVVKDSSR